MSLADRMKAYEAVEASRKLSSSQPVIARLDGRKFSKFLRRFETPFDVRFTDAMADTCKALVEETQALFGYVQTDEISLVWYLGDDVDPDHHLLFDGRIQKLCSVLSGFASASFVSALLARCDAEMHEGILKARPHFDARIWNVPDKTEAANYILWRAFECEKNAISAFARHWLSAEQMKGLDGEAQLAAALQAGSPSFDNVRAEDRYGRYCKKVLDTRALTARELSLIPETHRPADELSVCRTRMVVGPFLTRELSEVRIQVFG